jgi:hypothetical protein
MYQLPQIHTLSANTSFSVSKNDITSVICLLYYAVEGEQVMVVVSLSHVRPHVAFSLISVVTKILNVAHFLFYFIYFIYIIFYYFPLSMMYALSTPQNRCTGCPSTFQINSP